MNPGEMRQGRVEREDWLEQRLTRALEAPPAVAIPADFAATVASRVPARAGKAEGWRVAGSRVGGYVAWGASAVLLAVVAGLASSRAQFQGKQWFELGLEVEFAMLTAWLSLRARLRE